MNTASHSASPEQAAELFARRLTARLSADTDALPYDISERLRAAREQALAQRKKVVPVREWHHATAVQRQGHTATLGSGDNEGRTWWRALISAVPLVALLVGLVVVVLMLAAVGWWGASRPENQAWEVGGIAAFYLAYNFAAYWLAHRSQLLRSAGEIGRHYVAAAESVLDDFVVADVRCEQ